MSLPEELVSLSRRQLGVVARRQLLRHGINRHHVRAQVRAGRWQTIGPEVVVLTTGELTRGQRMWAGVLHAGERAAVGGITALQARGLDRWHREAITVLVPKSLGIDSFPGVTYVETRRPTVPWCGPGTLPMWRVEPAALLVAGYSPSIRTAHGLLAACVQQRLTTPDELDRWARAMRPLRRSKPMRAFIAGLAGGIESLAEADLSALCRAHRIPPPTRQVQRVGSDGRTRYTDAEWHLSDGRVVVLEIDGGLHHDVGQWQRDVARERALVATGVIMLRCTAWELRHDSAAIARDLRLLGVGSSC
ncbi:hypothetical protein NLS1_04290 [Nocardioides sp. LS1]|nr:hypothetical protein NLS1_04290 [Nocardioides sp. LS1]